jgi:hypothetical protein
VLLFLTLSIITPVETLATVMGQFEMGRFDLSGIVGILKQRKLVIWQ